MKKLDLSLHCNHTRITPPLTCVVKKGKLRLTGAYRRFRLDADCGSPVAITAWDGAGHCIEIVAESAVGRKLIKLGLVTTYAERKTKATLDDLAAATASAHEEDLRMERERGRCEGRAERDELAEAE